MGPRHLAEEQVKKSTLDLEGGIGMMSEILGGVGVICKAFIFNVNNILYLCYCCH